MSNKNFSFPGNGALLISWDFTKGRDNDLILVAQKDTKEPGGLKIINAFSGPEAMDIYKKLVTKVERPD